jgi:hypothetical protein
MYIYDKVAATMQGVGYGGKNPRIVDLFTVKK